MRYFILARVPQVFYSVRDLVEEYPWQPMYKTTAISFSKPVSNHA